MRLVARIERRDKYGYKLYTREDIKHVMKLDRTLGTVTLFYPAGSSTRNIPERIIEHNLGSRPWSEGFCVDANSGEKIVSYGN